MRYFIFRPSKLFIVTFLIVVLVGAYVGVALFAPLPKLNAQLKTLNTPKDSPGSLTWTSAKQAAIGAEGYGVLATNGTVASAPIGSIAKTMLVLGVLDKHPLAVGQTGPIIAMTDNDVTLYKNYLAQNGSVVPIQAGEQLTEYQLLQALLLPSGDNIADTLANWSFGSVDNYLAYANQKAKDLQLTQTHFADSSGLSSQTVSSAHDLVLLGQEILKQPVLAQIVNQPQVTLPIAGVEKNYNTLLGGNNVVGIKTGNTDEAGGCFLVAAKDTIDGQPVTILAAFQGASDLNAVRNEARTFLQTNTPLLHAAKVAADDQSVGSFSTPWGFTSKILPQDDVSAVLLPGTKVTTQINVTPLTLPATKGQTVGTVTIKSGTYTQTVPLVLNSALSRPRKLWRLTHPLAFLHK